MTFGLLDREAETTPGFSTPAVTLEFGGGGGGLGGALGGLAPDIGPFGTSAGLESGLLSLEIVRGFAPAVDWAEVHLKLPPGGPELPSLGDTGQVGIEVGGRDTGFACTVERIEHRSDGSVILGLGNGGRMLAQARSTTAFTDTGPAEIISALCGEAGVTANASGGGDIMARYVVDRGMSLLDHVARLATGMGRLAMFDDSGTLVLVDDAASGEEIPLAAGDAIADAHLVEQVEAGGLRATGAGASDGLTLRKSPGPLQVDTGTAPLRDQSTPWLRSAGLVQTHVEARARAFARQTKHGRVLLVAYPDAQPGALVALSGTALDGTSRVMSSHLRFDAQQGFSNTIHIAESGSGGGALGLLGGFL